MFVVGAGDFSDDSFWIGDWVFKRIIIVRIEEVSVGKIS
jgi:hypothetical protein